VAANAAFLAANAATATDTTQNNSITAAFNTANAAFLAANAATATDTTQNNSITAAFTRANNSINANTGGTITGDLSISGNLTVTGLTTYTNTTTVLIADNIITVNAAINQSSQPAVNAGIEVDRGAQPNSSFLWIESSGKWSANNGNGSIFIASDSAESYANSAFVAANAATATDTTQNNSITAAFNTANAAFLAANAATATDTTQNNSITAAFAAANAATATDTTQNNSITAAFAVANNALTSANGAIAWNTANAAFLAANAATATDTTQNNSITAAFAAANAATTTNITQNNSITAAFAAANAAFTSSNTKANIASPTFSGFVGIGKTGAVALDVNGAIHGNTIFRNTEGGSAAVPSIQPGNDNDTGMFHVPTNIIGFSTGGIERMRINASGNTGIGTASPNAALHVAGLLDGFPTGNGVSLGAGSGGYGRITLIGPQGGFIDFSSPGVNNYKGRLIYANSDNSMAFYTNAAESMRINSAGNVGIGNTNPTEKLHVTGNILASQNITAYSDRRIKKDIRKIENALEKIKSITGVLYKRIDLDDDRVYTGVIAQEVEAVLPEVVFESNNLKTVAYGNMIGLVIEAIKEQQTQIDELKNQLSGLTTIINTLRLGTKN
jgi:hypothetical protein